MSDAVSIAGISLSGRQGEPAGTMTVTAHMSDGSEIVLIQDNGNVISHWKNTSELAASTPVAGWEDISTAPKDGTRFLATDGVNVTVIEWKTYFGIWERLTGWNHLYGERWNGPKCWMPLPNVSAPPPPSVSTGSRPREAVPTEQADGAVVDLREALSGLLAFTGMFTPEQFATAMWGVHGDELVGVSEVANKFDKAQADAWTALSATPQPADGCSSNEGAA